MGTAGSKPAPPPPLPKRDVQRVEMLEIPALESHSMDKPGYSIRMSEYQKLCDGYMAQTGGAPGAHSSPGGAETGVSPKALPAVTVRAVPEGPFYPPRPNRRHVHYVTGRVIGQGSYGKVYLATEQITGQMLAVKQVSIGSCSAEALQSLDAETRLLCNLQHPNLVRVYDVEVDREAGSLSLVMEYVPGGSLSALTKQLGGIPELLCRRYVRQLVDALVYMHLHRVAHLDLKCSNVMLSGDGSLKLVDFGSATRLCRAELGDDFAALDAPAAQGSAREPPQDSPARVRIGMKGSPYWIAPECVRYPVYDVFKADIWSLGCLVIEMLNSYPPFFQFKQIPVLLYHVATLKEPPPLPSVISGVAADFLRRCLCVDPKARATIFELAAHPWIADINLGLELRPLQPYTRGEYYRSPGEAALETLPEEDSSSSEGESGNAGKAGEPGGSVSGASGVSGGPDGPGTVGAPGAPGASNAPTTSGVSSAPPAAPPAAPHSGAAGSPLGTSPAAPQRHTALPEPPARSELGTGRVEDDPVAMAVLAETATGGGPDGPTPQLLRRGGEGPPISSFRLTASVLFDVLLGGREALGSAGGGAHAISAKRLWARSSVPLGLDGESASLGIEELDDALFAYESSEEDNEGGERRGSHSSRGRQRRAGYDRDTRVFGDLTEPEWLFRAHDELFSAAEKGGAP